MIIIILPTFVVINTTKTLSIMETKTFTRQLLVALFCIATAFNAWSYDLELDGIYYNLSGSTAIVTYAQDPSVASYSGNVTIPSTITHNGTTYNVTVIGERAFNLCTDLTSITIPYSITVIENYAFYGCTNLYGSNGYYFFHLPESVTYIGDYVFSGGNAIVRFVVDDNNTSYCGYNDALYSKNKTKLVCYPANSPNTDLTNSDFPSTLTTIGDGAFSGSKTLTSIEIPGTVTTIGGWAFDDCSGLNRVVIPESVTTIGPCAFRYDDDLNTVICLTRTPPSIDNEAFTCFSVAKLIVPESSVAAYNNAEYWQDFSAIKAANFNFVSEQVFYKITNATDKTVAVVRSVNEQNFNSNDYVGSISVPASVTHKGDIYTVTKVDNFAFYYNKQLQYVSIPRSVTRIGERAFYGCESLSYMNLANGLTDIGAYAIALCSNLTSIYLPESLESIGVYAFYWCNSLTEVIIPDAVTTIGNGTFNKCSSLGAVVLGAGVTSIGANAFAECSSLTCVNSAATTPPVIQSNTFMTSHYNNATLTVPETALSAYQQALYWSNFTTIEQTGETFEANSIYYFINDDGHTASVTYRDTNYNSYSGNVDIPEYVYHNGMNYLVSAIGPRAFMNCRSLYSVSFPYRLTSIGSNSFDNCTALTSVSLPASLTEIGDYAFYGCSSLNSISLNLNLKTISQFSFSHTGLTSLSIPASVDSINSTAFNYSNSLNNITVNTSNLKYCSIDGVLFSRDKKILVAYPNAHAADYTLPNGTEIISNSAFRGCEVLAHVTLPTSLRQIKQSAFFDNINLEEIVVPRGVTTIENSAFSGCSRLSRAELPTTLTSIGYLVFNDATNLTQVVVKATTPPTCASRMDPRTHELYETFMNTHYTYVTLTVPAGCTAAYQAAGTWKKFTHIEETDFPLEGDRGDVNGDGTVDINDVTTLIDYLLGSNNNIATSAADCNLDNAIDISDVTTLIDYLLTGSWGDKKSIELWGLVGMEFGSTPWGIGGGSIGVDLQPLYPIQGYSYDDYGHGIIECTGYFKTNYYFSLSKADRSEQINNNGGSFNVEEDGYYTIRLNTATREVSIIPYAGEEPALYSSMCIAGDVNSWMYEDTYMLPVNPRAQENHDWYITLNAEAGTMLKFVHGVWEAYWGTNSFPYGTGTAVGDNITVPAGQYQVMFNDITGNYIFVPGTYPYTDEW